MSRIIPLLFIILASTSSYAQTGNEAFKIDFLEKWSNQKTYLLELLEMMPEEHYDFKPTEEEMTFKKLVIHITSNMLWLSKSYLEGGEFEALVRNADPSKAELIDYVSRAFDFAYQAAENTPPHYLETRVSFFAGEKNIRQMYELMDDHLTHHKGQLTVYLRLNGLKPPRFVGW